MNAEIQLAELSFQNAPPFDQTMAAMLINSGIFGNKYKRTEEVLAIVQMGKEQGLSPMQALQAGYSIQGRSDFEVRARWALVQQAKNENGTPLLSGYRIKSSDEACTVFLERDNGHTKNSVEATFTLAHAEKAGLLNKQVWKQYPAKMLYWRALGNAIDMLFPDVKIGLHQHYELNAFDESQTAVRGADPSPDDDPWLNSEAINIKAPPAQIISDAQRKRLFAIAKPRWTDAQIKDYLQFRGYKSSKDILASDYESICAYFETYDGSSFKELGQTKKKDVDVNYC